jgi:hypothetical protein
MELPPDIAYAAHTESCTFMLDKAGICRFVVKAGERVTFGGHFESGALPAHAERCIGAQYVASLALGQQGGLIELPAKGMPLLFARIEPNGRIALVRTGPLVRFQENTDSGVRRAPERDTALDLEERGRESRESFATKPPLPRRKPLDDEDQTTPYRPSRQTLDSARPSQPAPPRPSTSQNFRVTAPRLPLPPRLPSVSAMNEASEIYEVSDASDVNEVSEVSEPSTIPLRRPTHLPPPPSMANDMPPYRPRAATRRPSLVRVSRPSAESIPPLPMPLTRRAR